MTNLICMAILLATTAGQAKTAPMNPALTRDAVDRVFHRMYNSDFAGAHALATEEIRKHPDDPLFYALRAGALLFLEFDRMKILELDFFADNDSVTDRKKLKPDLKIRADFFQATGQARKLASARLAADPNDANAIFALFVAVGEEANYAILVEKKYIRSYSLSKETQKYSRELLAMNPPLYDAYLSSAMLEYVVGNLNFFFRLFIRPDQIIGDKQKAIEYLKLVIDHGRYYSPYAKILLSGIYLRDNKPESALDLLKELDRDFPANPLIRKEVIRVSAKIGTRQPDKSGR
jgi:tetratricopeptide (TPR) repeat protein